ncbi:XopAD/skwp family type III secretion system effector [Xanthomonas populi]
MKTSNVNPNSFKLAVKHSHEKLPRPAEDQAAASTRSNPQSLGRPPGKRRRVESDETGASTRHREPLPVDERTGANEGAWDRRLRQQSVARSYRRDDPTDRRGTAPEWRPDNMPAYASASLACRRPQPAAHNLEATADLRLTERQSNRPAVKRSREERESHQRSQRPRREFELSMEDLRRTERQLDPTAKKRLRAERERYRQQLSASNRGAQNHNARLCVSMAQDNELAHRSSGWLALPFLDETINAQTNAQWLDKYLQMIANARPVAGAAGAVVTHRDLDRNTELAAQYLYKTGWFEAASLKQLAHVGNKLSKHLNQQACMDAIAWIAGQVEQADDLLELVGNPLVLLLNAFAKNTDSGRCKRAVARLARHLQRDHKARQSLDPRGIGLSLNAFSKWFDNPDCQSMAHSLAALLASDSRLRYAMDAQSVANTLNALSKWPDTPVCAAAASALASRLADERSLCHALKPQEVGTALNALSKWPDTPVCAAAVSALALRLADDRRLRNALEPQGVANALNALSKFHDTPVCAEAVSALAGRLAVDRGLRNALEPQGVANALNALSKFPDTPVCAEAVSALAERLADDPGLRKALDQQGIANALNALSKFPDTEVCAAATSRLAERLADDSGLRKALDPQGVANALNALSKFPDTEVCAEALSALAARLVDDPGLRNALDPINVTQALNALSKLPDTEVCAAAASMLALRLVLERDLRDALKSQEVATALNALSKFPSTEVCAEAVSALAARLVDDSGLRNALDPINVAQALNALSKFPSTEVCAEAVSALAARLVDDPGLRNALDPNNVTQALNALSKLPDLKVSQAAAEALALRLADERSLCDALKPQEVAIALNALSKFPDTPVCVAAVSALAARLADDPGLCDALEPQEVANALNALSKLPDTPVCVAAVSALARRLADDRRLRQALNSLDLASALNALSKLPDAPFCTAAVKVLALRLADDPGLRKALDPQGVANALNALSKFPDTEVCAAAVSALAARLADDPWLCKALDPQGVATVLNALSKLPDTPVCVAAASTLAARLVEDPGLCDALKPQEVTTALNALSKLPDSPVCAAAVSALAARLADDPGLCNALDPQGVANALNALSKLPDSPVCAAAASALAARLADDSELCNALDPINVTTALNALSKFPDTEVCAAAVSRLAARLADDSELCNALDPQGVAIALNALSKWPDTQVCAEAVSALAARLADDPRLCNALDPQGVANALNALSKWPDTPVCAAAVSALAARLADDPGLRNALDPIHLTQALNALSKFPDTPACETAIDVLAARLAEDHDLRQVMEAQHVALSLNALSKCFGRPACQPAGVLLAERAGSAELPWQQFEMRWIAMVANAMSRLLHLAEEQFQTLGGAKLQAMAGHLDLHRERFESASASDIGTLFKALSSARLHRQMRPLARPALERVSVLVGGDGLRETNLEGIGSLCMGLLPLIRSPELTSRHRGHALRALNTLQPIVERKIDIYLSGGGSRSSTDIEQHATRCPALTFFQVLKAYAMVSRQWKPRHVEGSRVEVRQRRDQLAKWVDLTLERTREAIEADLGEMSWNLIAQIEAGEQVFDALDLRMAKEAPKIAQAHPPSDFGLGAGRLSMCSEPGQPRAPASGTGSTTHIVVDLRGKEVSTNAAETNKPYSLFARLTGQPLVEVQLPGSISTFMLARTLTYQGEPWRFDMFGGSRATRGNMTRPVHLLSGTSGASSMLPAIRYADTVPGSSLMKLVAKLAPQREDWSRMQRSLLEMVSSDHVVEGTLRIGFFDDVSGPEHPFKPLAPDGRPLALCPNDGCGFLKLEVAKSIPAFRKYFSAWQAVQAGQASQEQRDLLGQDKGPTRLAPQALQHFPRDEMALQEAHEAMQRRLKALPPALNKLALFELATSGGYQGQRVRAVPSADDKVHLPRERSQAFDAAGGPLLIGKPPYDKENLLPVPEERVATVAKGDATAEFLSQSFGIQYSYTGFDDTSDNDEQMLHSKGMLIVVPEKSWPADFANTDLVCSKEDLKTLSSWTSGRDRSAVPRDMLSTGSLRLKDIVEPGRLGALPIAELRKRNMDTDGDDAFVYAGYPKLAALISREMADREERRGQPQSFKPPKTATPGIDPESGHYQAGRLSEIMSLQRGGKIMGAASTLAARFMAQPDELREAMARSMMFGTYDGIERDLRNGLRQVLEGEQRDPQMLEGLRAQAHEAIERAHMPEAREAAELLYAQLLGLEQASAASADAPHLPDALAEAFPQLAEAYAAAPDAEARIHAILDNYPVCRLSRAQFPKGQPGLIPGEPELSMRNLFTIAIKVGTDALKSDTGTALFAKIVESCERSERAFAERVRIVPYSKTTARAMHDGSFDAEQTTALLQRMPTMAAGVMQDALRSLQQARLIDPPPPPAQRLRAVRAEDITRNAQALLTRAREMEPVVTDMLESVVQAHDGRLVGKHLQLKSLGSLVEKLGQQVALKHKTLEQAAAGVNDALRYSVVLDQKNFSSGLRSVLAALDDQGHARVKLTNFFTKRRQTFKAVNVTMRGHNDALWEIQFHTQDTFALKERFHDVYKSGHTLKLEGAPLSDQDELMAPAREAFGLIATPPGCDEIDDWEEENVPAVAISAPVVDSKLQAPAKTPQNSVQASASSTRNGRCRSRHLSAG